MSRQKSVGGRTKGLAIVGAGLMLALLLACQGTSKSTPTPAATPTVKATPVVTPTRAATPSPSTGPTATATSSAPVTVPSDFKTYEDTTFGFKVLYPPAWQSEPTGLPNPLVQMQGPEGSKLVSLIRVIYNRDVTAPDAMIDNLIPQLLERSGFRTLREEEKDLALKDGTPAFQTMYQWTGTGPMQGVLFATTRGSQGLLVQVEAPQDVFNTNIQDIRAMLSSFQMQEPAPLGIPRSEALTLYLDDGPLTLDPAIAQESQSIQYITLIYSGLMSFDSKLTLTGELTQGWNISGNGTVFTFTLRSNARFHDGRPVTAQDVKYSWERAASKDTGSPTAGTYLDDIVGFADFVAGKATEIKGIEALDDRMLRVTIDAPKAYFLSKLAHPVTYVVDRNQVEKETTASGLPWEAEPNGTGPFRMNQWDFGIVMVLDANKDYYRTPPKVPHVVFRLYGGIPSVMYDTGEIDAAQVFPDQVADIGNPKNPLSGDLRANPELSVFYVGFATNKPPFDDPLVRKAFLLAVDRQKILHDVWQDTRQMAHGILPPGLPGYNPDTPSIRYDPQQAKLLLSQSKYGGAQKLPTITYTTSGTSDVSPAVAALLDMWKANLGVDVQVRLMDSNLYYYTLDTAVDNLFDYGWVADYPDAHDFLDVLFHSGADNNKGKYRNPQVDALLDNARVELDAQKRTQMYQQAEKMLVDDAAAIPLQFGKSYTLVKPYVKGLSSTPLGMLDLRDTSLASR